MQPNPDAAAVAAKVRGVLGELNISGAELARRMDVTQTYIARRLRAKQPFDVTDLMSAARALEVPVTRFLPDESPASAAAAS